MSVGVITMLGEVLDAQKNAFLYGILPDSLLWWKSCLTVDFETRQPQEWTKLWSFPPYCSQCGWTVYSWVEFPVRLFVMALINAIFTSWRVLIFISWFTQVNKNHIIHVYNFIFIPQVNRIWSKGAGVLGEWKPMKNNRIFLMSGTDRIQMQG